MTSPTLEDRDAGRLARTRRQRRRQILKAATAVFAERGYHEAGINDVIAHAAIARGTFYLYFSSKRAVFAAILDEALAELRARVGPIRLAPGAPAPAAQLRVQLERVVDYLLDHPALTALLLGPGLSPNDDVVGRLQAFYDEVHAMLATSLEHGIKLDLVRPCDTRVVAAALLGAVRGLVAHLSRHGSPSPRADCAEQLLRVALSGVLKSSPD